MGACPGRHRDAPLGCSTNRVRAGRSRRGAAGSGSVRPGAPSFAGRKSDTGGKRLNPSAALPDLAAVVCAMCILLVPLAGAGLALINTGLGRSRNAAHSMMSSLCVLAVAAAAYFICGFSWQGFAGRAAYAIQAGGKLWDWIGADPFFLRGVDFGGSSASLVALLGMFSAGLAALIPLGS